MSKFLMIVTVDENDADYIKREYWVTQETIDKIKPIWKVVKKNRNDNWVTGDVARAGEKPQDMYKGILSKKEIEFFDSYIPSGEFGAHTIESIEIHEVVNTIKL